MKEDKEIREFLTENDKDGQDKILKSWITQTLDDELRDEMAQALNEDHGVKRTAAKTFVLRRLWPVLATAASLALLISLYVLNQNQITPSTMASQYLEAQTINHPGSFKGVAKSDVNRTQGIAAFNNGDFKGAALNFEKITTPNEEDNHYLGLAYLKNKEFTKAIAYLKKGASKNSRYQEESFWFLSLAYILNGQDTSAKEQLREIKEGEWQYDKAQKLLKKMED